MLKDSVYSGERREKGRLSIGEVALLIALLLECVFFAESAPSFATWGNFFEVLRFSAGSIFRSARPSA